MITVGVLDNKIVQDILGAPRSIKRIESLVLISIGPIDCK